MLLHLTDMYSISLFATIAQFDITNVLSMWCLHDNALFQHERMA